MKGWTMKHIKNYQEQRARDTALRLVVWIAALTIMLAGCSANPYIPLRDENRANLVKLDLGMTKAQAIQTMGDKSASGRYGTFTNPYKREIIKAPTGEIYDVLYYYTEQTSVRRMRTSWEQGVTPVIFKDDKIVGIGWNFLELNNLKSATTVRRR
jgi:hypothetical protein